MSNYPGLVPKVYMSGDTVRDGRITKRGNGCVRALLVQAARAEVRSKNGGAVKERYEYMTKTKGISRKKAIATAHDGEAGKGFAVAADEIRKLAESSGEQSKTIGTVLKKIKESIDKITRSTDNVLNKFEAIDGGVKVVPEQTASIRNAMEQSAGSRQILEVIGQLNDITRVVKSGSEEMLEGSREVITEGKNLEMATQESTNGMNEMATGADQINVAVHRVNEISGQNKENIDVLVREVSRFKVD